MSEGCGQRNIFVNDSSMSGSGHSTGQVQAGDDSVGPKAEASPALTESVILEDLNFMLGTVVCDGKMSDLF